MKNKVLLSIIAAIIFLGGGYGLYMWLGSMQKPPAKRAAKQQIMAVKTQNAKPSVIEAKIITFGRVQSEQPVDIVAEVSGKIRERVHLQVGQSVRKGQVLFTLGKETFELGLQAKKSDFMREVATILPDMKIDYSDRYETWSNYFASLDVEKSLPKLPSYKSEKEKTFLATKGILTSYYNLKAQEATLDKYIVTAPFSGSISEIYLQNGSVAPPNGKVLRLAQNTQLELKVPVDTKDVHWLKTGTKVSVATEDESQQWTGTIARIGDIVNATTQSLDVYVKIQNGKDPIYTGMYLRATMEGGTIQNAIEVPRSAVFNDNEIYTVKNDSILHLQTVQIKKSNKETLIIAGINEGEKVVVESLINAYDEMIVKTLNEKAKTVSVK
ncbi:RND family efflux transporter, MFP subunit [Bernardetia litoralis DSM 6794]|uniref:RND family efflux transporter, MFP subunit n=1 Tax=Bernardetia litoralis (strain ATCC 23117 / DSM 6794 / NBRC 15988 / NCIMB 1366 / Fx l1 / Sio-4) TaxID=880071 RepID=I4AJC7_BERLS|nr:efflux RND transporter periplasmic adaptor subunit [Bernardetia litoralis]AFM04062.1 RND family efflux transporter, MFP subunit [Bernardetia litoralis DSM 6794]